MTIPSNIIGLASAATGGIAKGVTEVIKTKEHQKTIRLQNKMQAVNGGAECLKEIVSAYCAIASGNNEHLQLALDKITELAKSSPFQDLANLSTVQAALLDPDHEWKF